VKKLWLAIGLAILVGMVIHLLIGANNNDNPVMEPAQQIRQPSTIKMAATQTSNSRRSETVGSSSVRSRSSQQSVGSTFGVSVSPEEKQRISASQQNERPTPDDMRHDIFDKNMAIFNGLTLKQHHEEFEKEPIDEKWSNEMEGRLMNFFASTHEAAQFNIDGITCRTTQCEILLDVNGGTNPFTSQQLSSLIATMKEKPWWDFSSLYTSEGQDATFIVLLQRKPTS